MTTLSLRFLFIAVLLVPAAASAQSAEEDVEAAARRLDAVDDNGASTCADVRDNAHSHVRHLKELLPKMHVHYKTREERDDVLRSFRNTLDDAETGARSLAACVDEARSADRIKLGLGGGVLAAGGIVAAVLIRKRRRARSR